MHNVCICHVVEPVAEKNMVLDMIRAALTSREEYYKSQPAQDKMDASENLRDRADVPSPGDTLPAKAHDVITRIDR